MGDAPLEWRIKPGELEMILRHEVDVLVAQARLNALEEAARELEARDYTFEDDGTDYKWCAQLIRALKKETP